LSIISKNDEKYYFLLVGVGFREVFYKKVLGVKRKYFTSILSSAKLCNCEINTWRCK